jgi:hypothetical protein
MTAPGEAIRRRWMADTSRGPRRCADSGRGGEGFVSAARVNPSWLRCGPPSEVLTLTQANHRLRQLPQCGQWRARRNAVAGIYGNAGNVDSVTYRI